MNTIKKWFVNARPTALPQSLIPSILAICLAYASYDFSWWLGLLAVLGVIFAHLGLNLFDDYFDYRKKQSTYRDELVHKGFRARIGKCTYLTSGEATLNQLLAACIVLCGTAVVLGAVIFYFRGLVILYIALITAFLGIEYSGPPFRLSYYGLGELIIGIIFGPLNMMGVYYAACGELNEMILLISVTVGLLVMNIVYVHSILDFIPDSDIGKNTMAVVLQNDKPKLIAQFLILFLPYFIIVLGVLVEYFSPWFLLAFITLPQAVSLFYLMVEFVKHPYRIFKPRFWMGPMNNWKRISEAGIDWFMIRWLSARNLLVFFCLTLIIASFLM